MSALISSHYAQTNVQLYDQMLSDGYSNSDVATIQHAYDSMQPLFSASFRGSGRPFLTHLVGTASILAEAKQPITIIVAGLCHAAYEFGDFGPGLRHRSMKNRQKLQRWIGTEAEALVWDYAHLDWSLGAINSYPSEAADSDILCIRLANELEDALIDNWSYSGLAKQKRSHETAIASAQLAARLGVENWHVRLGELTSEHARLTQTTLRGRGRSYAMPGHSYRLKLSARFLEVAKVVYHWFHRN